MTPIDPALVARARDAAAVIAPLAGRIESDRRLPPEAFRALVEAGVFKLLVPRELGGADARFATVLAVLEEIAAADGSAGWVAMIGATSSIMCRFLPEDVAREVYGPDGAMTCGVFAPMGRAKREDGGYRVSGRWPFASGCEHAAFRMGGAIVAGDPPLPNGAPDVRSFLFRADETTIVDTWDASGLRGTGSHDIEANDVFVPESRTFSLLTGTPRRSPSSPAIPFFATLAASVAAVAIGIARASVDAIVALAKTKAPAGAKRTLAHRDTIQLDVARAAAKVHAARAFLREALASAEDEAARDGAASVRARATLRLAAAHAAAEAASAVDLAYHAGGATSVYGKNPLQRHFRDVHVATQHVMVAPTSAIMAGRVFLDVETDLTAL